MSEVPPSRLTHLVNSQARVCDVLAHTLSQAKPDSGEACARVCKPSSDRRKYSSRRARPSLTTRSVTHMYVHLLCTSFVVYHSLYMCPALCICSSVQGLSYLVERAGLGGHAHLVNGEARACDARKHVMLRQGHPPACQTGNTLGFSETRQALPFHPHPPSSLAHGGVILLVKIVKPAT